MLPYALGINLVGDAIAQYGLWAMGHGTMQLNFKPQKCVTESTQSRMMMAWPFVRIQGLQSIFNLNSWWITGSRPGVAGRDSVHLHTSLA